MNKCIICSFLLLLLACKKENLSIKNSNSLDFSMVDSPPVFINCETMIGEDLEECFKQKIQKVFNDEFLKIDRNSLGKLNNKFTIRLTFHKIKGVFLDESLNPHIFANENLEIRKVILEALTKLQISYPATKKGIPVTTIYKLPFEVTIQI